MLDIYKMYENYKNLYKNVWKRLQNKLVFLKMFCNVYKCLNVC